MSESNRQPPARGSERFVMTTRALSRIVFGLVLILFPLGLAVGAQDGLAATRLEATLATQGVLLLLRVQPLGQVGNGQSVTASAIAVSRPNEAASIRGIRFVARDRKSVV